MWFLIGIVQITEEERHTMAEGYRMALEGLLRKAQMEEDTDFLREGVRALGQALMELEVSPAPRGREARADSR